MAGAGVKEWGTCAHDGKEVKLFTIRAPSGAYATATNYGATLTSLWVPDRNGTLGDVLLGYDSFSGYEAGANRSFSGRGVCLSCLVCAVDVFVSAEVAMGVRACKCTYTIRDVTMCIFFL